MKRLQTRFEKSGKQLKLSSSLSKVIDNEQKTKLNTSIPKKFGSFLSLEASMNDEKIQVYKNEKYICIKDKYPKAKVHFLLIPHGDKMPKLLRLADLISLPKSVDILKEMKFLSDQLIEKNVPNDLKSKTLCGFHAIQSMQPLHMHIITTDFESECLKNKKHWNSFTTQYFIKIEDLIKCLEDEKDYFKNDKFNLNNQQILKKYLDLPLKCNSCQAEQKNIPTLKRHIIIHK